MWRRISYSGDCNRHFKSHCPFPASLSSGHLEFQVTMTVGLCAACLYDSCICLYVESSPSYGLPWKYHTEVCFYRQAVIYLLMNYISMRSF